MCIIFSTLPAGLKALQYAINTAKDDSFIVVCTEKVKETLKYVAERKELIQVSV